MDVKKKKKFRVYRWKSNERVWLPDREKALIEWAKMPSLLFVWYDPTWMSVVHSLS